MNKNCAFYAILVLSVAFVFYGETLIANQLTKRRDYINLLSRNRALGVAQYVCNGEINISLLDRDIAIIEQDCMDIIKQKSSAEGFIYKGIVPAVLKTIQVCSGMLAIYAASFAAIFSYGIYDIWNSPMAEGFTERWQKEFEDSNFKDYRNRMFGTLFYNLAYCESKYKFLTDNAIDKYDQAALRRFDVRQIVGLALLMGFTSRWSEKKLSHYKKKNKNFIQKMQERYEQNQVIIAQLQQIRYEITSYLM